MDGGNALVARLKLPDRLPQLQGHWLHIFVVLWFLTLPLAIVGPTASSILLYQRSSFLPFGFTILQDDTRLVLTTVWGEDARAAGLRAGDQLMTVAGQRVETGAPREHLEVAEGSPVVMGFARGGQPLGDVSIPRRAERAEILYSRAWLSQPAGRSIELVLTLLPMMFLIAAAVALFLRRHDTTAAFMSLAFLLMSATSFWLPIAWREWGLESWSAPLSDGGWSLLVVVLLAFPGGRLDPPWTGWAAAAVPVWFLITAFTDPPASVENFGDVLLLTAALLALGQRYRSLGEGSEKQQLRWAFLGFAYGIPVLAAAAVLLASWGVLVAWDMRFVIWVPLLAFLLVCCSIGFMAGGLLVALLRYRLYNAEAVISRSVGYTLMTFILTSTFAIISKLLDWALPQLIGKDAGPVPELAGIVIGLLVVAPSQEGLNRWADRRFRKPLADLRDRLPLCVDRLSRIASPSEIADEIVATVTEALRPQRVTLLVGYAATAARNVSPNEIEAWLTDHSLDSTARRPVIDRSDQSFPVRVPLSIRAGGTPLGWILLGPRLDNSLYLRDEQEALTTIAMPAAQALKATLSRAERARELAARLDAIEMAVGMLRKRTGMAEDRDPPVSARVARSIPSKKGDL